MLQLPPPNRYTPWFKGVYDVAPNLRLLGDEPAIEFNTLWPAIRANKEREEPGRILRRDLSDDVAEAAFKELATRAAREWPRLFTLGDVLQCHLTGERVADLDGIAMNLPCDLAIVCRDARGDWTAYLHVSAPSHWRPEEKIGKPFIATHAPIPHFDRVNAAAKGLVEAMVSKGPWVRFVWGFETDAELDHHPDRAPGRSFASKPFVVRVERQVLLPLPEHHASIFLIGMGFVDRKTVLASESLWRPLKNALLGMSPQAREYKGVAAEFEGLLTQFPA